MEKKIPHGKYGDSPTRLKYSPSLTVPASLKLALRRHRLFCKSPNSQNNKHGTEYLLFNNENYILKFKLKFRVTCLLSPFFRAQLNEIHWASRPWL